MPVVVTPPPITMPPGPAPLTKSRLEGNVRERNRIEVERGARKSGVKVFRICGEKMCVS